MVTQWPLEIDCIQMSDSLRTLMQPSVLRATIEPTTVHTVKSIQTPDHLGQHGQRGHRRARARLDHRSQQLLHAHIPHYQQDAQKTEVLYALRAHIVLTRVLALQEKAVGTAHMHRNSMHTHRIMPYLLPPLTDLH